MNLTFSDDDSNGKSEKILGDGLGVVIVDPDLQAAGKQFGTFLE
jgi:hypothetical protein